MTALKSGPFKSKPHFPMISFIAIGKEKLGAYTLWLFRAVRFTTILMLSKSFLL
jgi:hypothetical protein